MPVRFTVTMAAIATAGAALAMPRAAHADAPCDAASAPAGLHLGASGSTTFSDAFGELTFVPACATTAIVTRADEREAAALAAPSAAGVAQVVQEGRPIAFSYSDGYQARARWHKRASFATLPLFAIEAYLGQNMFNHPSTISSQKQRAHMAVGIGIAGLFGVNSVTGVWNLIEARKDPNGLIKRTIHGTLMLVADAGFVASSLSRPNTHDSEGLLIYDAKKNQHMAIAYSSIAVASVGYLIMLIH